MRYKRARRGAESDEVAVNPLFARLGEERVPRFSLPTEEMLPETAYQLIHDELLLDGNARQNLASFVTTWMDREADDLYREAADKNLVDRDEYPLTAAIEERCVHIIAGLWHAPDTQQAMGVSTVGSSEACMLAGLALRRRWERSRRQAGKPSDRPNIVFSSAVQVVWEKFANYWGVEARHVPVTAEHPHLTAAGVLDVVDENTIGVVPVLGLTFTGCYEPVAEIASALDDLSDRTGLDIPIHVDAASGGFFAPFLHQEVRWDFRLNRVHSINASGHKYGLVYPGVGWVVWRLREYVPDELVFDVSYLGGDMATYGLNFSRPGAQVLLQYFNFLRLGRRGFTRVHQVCQDVAVHIAGELDKSDAFEVISAGTDLPVVCWRLADGRRRNWDLYDLSNRLRDRGWMVRAYPMPKNIQDMVVMRIVVRNGFSIDLAHLLLDDVREAVDYLNHLEAPLPRDVRETKSFHH